MAESEKQNEGPPPSYDDHQHQQYPGGVYAGPITGQPQQQPQQQQQAAPMPGQVPVMMGAPPQPGMPGGGPQQVMYTQQPGFQTQYGAYTPQPPVVGTTIIVNQPMPGAPGAAPRMWSTGICSFCDDMAICCCGLFFGTCLSCKVSNDMGESYCVPVCVPAADISLRVKWRTQENIQGSILDDCLTVWCCGPCAMCQLAREVKAKREGTLYPRQQ